MLSPQRISLLLAAALLVAVTATLIITIHGQGQTGTSPATNGITVLRKKGQKNLPPTAAEIAAFKKQQVPEERQLENNVPSHVPLKIKIKADKEAAFKDVNNEHWLRDLVIEVKNTGTKPIYFLHLQLHLDTKGRDGNGVGFVLLYGRTALLSVTEPLSQSDVPIRAGETHIFTIADRFVRGFERIVREDHVLQPKKVRIIFQNINFGDGTGYWGTSAEPLPEIRSEGGKGWSRSEKIEHRNTEKLVWPAIALNHWQSSQSVNNLPALLPANYYVEPSGSITIDAGSTPDLCCPGTSCSWAKQSFSRCYCSPIDDPEVQDAPEVQFLACSDSSGSCKTVNWQTQWCDFPNSDGTTFRLSCPISYVAACGSSPSPSPSSTPTPENCPSVCSDPSAAFPADECAWTASPITDAGCPLGYHRSDGCCIANPCPEPTPNPPACNGTLTWFAAPSCSWFCSQALPSPPPGGGGGGGGDADGGRTRLYDACTEYDWVLYGYMSGGWVEIARWYAGCF